MEANEFYDRIKRLPEYFENRDLEEYLRALYHVIENNNSTELSCELVLEMLAQAFVSEPIPFNRDWLNCNESPDMAHMIKKFTNPDIFEMKDTVQSGELDPKDFTREVLKFQIADLHKMRGKQLLNEYRYFGITSETGNYWYNFEPFGYLRCAARCMEDNEVDFASIDWSFIGELLEGGRIYE